MSISPAMTETRSRRDETEKSSNLKILKKKKAFAVDTLWRFSFPLKEILLFQIGHFRVPKLSHFQCEAGCKTFLVKMSFICMRIKDSFSYQRLSTEPRFKTEACNNSETEISKCQSSLRPTLPTPLKGRQGERDSLAWPPGG